MEILAERMKRLRLDNKMKQTDVAKILGIAISTYCSYEYGQREPNAGIVAALAQLYRVPADHLLGLDGPVPEGRMGIVLASASPRRKELLEQMGIAQFRVVSPDVDESVEAGLGPAEIVERLSLRQAQAAAGKVRAGDLVIAADTVVALDGAVLGKPRAEAAAFAMLSSLSGREHQVYTGVTVALGDRVVTQHEQTAVAFRELQPDEILGYIATGEPMDKAGAYGIQGLGSLLVEGISGDYYNVMGLPVCRLGRVLAGFGVDLLRPAGR